MSRLNKIKKLHELLPKILEQIGLFGSIRFFILRRYSDGKANSIHKFKPRRLNGQSISVRSGTTDIVSFQDFLTTRFYLPLWDLPPNPIIVDLGANIGTAAADYAATYPGARIVSVEMDQLNAQTAESNTSSFRDRLKVVHAAIWHESGIINYAGEGEDGFHVTLTDPAGRSVATITMEKLLLQEGLSHIDFLKIDIEGAEEQLICQGNPDWLKQVQSMSCEIHSDHLFEPILRMLERYNFETERDSRHWNCVLARKKLSN
jgi:FkbM family methyltransferase